MAVKLDHHVVIGMAGHIDHGKTAIIKALTGTNTDRLKEEKERGMTTDLGFAFMGNDITIIDVPGHEKFVKTMVAGVTTIDMALFVIAADDGVMPQTEEHLEILNLLQVKKALVVLNKIDMVDPEWAELVEADIEELLEGTSLEGAPILKVSATEGIGMEELKEAIFTMAQTTTPRVDKGLFRLFIDRVFTIKGFGTVVAGTVLSGKLSVDDSVEIQPKGLAARVRGVQVHGKPVQETEVGFRAAINLMRVEKEDIERGDVLVEPGFCQPTSMMDIRFLHLKSSPRPIKNRTRVRVHIGTSEVLARLGLMGKKEMLPGEEGFVQLRFEKPVVGERGDRVVVRNYSPVQTIGGGEIIDNSPRKHKQFDCDALKQVEQLYKGDPNQFLIDYFERYRFLPKSADELAKTFSLTKENCEKKLDLLIEQNRMSRVGKKRYIASTSVEMLNNKMVALTEEYLADNPLKLAISSATLKSQIKQQVDQNLFKQVLEHLEEEGTISLKGDKLFLAGHRVHLTEKEKEVSEAIFADFAEGKLTPPSVKTIVEKYPKEGEALLEYLIEKGDLIQVTEEMLFHRPYLKEALQKMAHAFQNSSEISIADFRTLFVDVSRKYVVEILAYADRVGLTQRIGDVRVVKDISAVDKL